MFFFFGRLYPIACVRSRVYQMVSEKYMVSIL